MPLIALVPVVQIVLFGYAVNLDPRNVRIAIAGSDDSSVERAAGIVNETGYFRIVGQGLPPGAAELMVLEGKALVGLELPSRPPVRATMRNMHQNDARYAVVCGFCTTISLLSTVEARLTRKHSGNGKQFFDAEKIVARQQSHFTALVQTNQIAIAGTGVLVQRQAAMMQDLLADMTVLLQSWSSQQDLRERLVKNLEVAGQIFEKSLGNGCELAELALKANTDTLDAITKHISLAFEEMRTSRETGPA
jgi:phasin family protein